MQLDDILNKERVQQGSMERNEPFSPIMFVFPQQKSLPSNSPVEPKNTEVHVNKPRTKGKVELYSDTNCKDSITPGSQINKDIIMVFALFNALSGTKGTRVPIDESVLFLGKRKNYQHSFNGVNLSAQLLSADSRIAIPLCNNCLRNSTQIFKIRTAIIDDGMVKVSASVTCSGSPPNSNKKLIVEFFIRDARGNIIWNGDSPIFTLFHHRSKRNVEKNEHAIKVYQHLGENIPKVSEPKLPTLKFNIPLVSQDNNTLMNTIEYCVNNMWAGAAFLLRGRIADDVKFSFGPHRITGLQLFLSVCESLAISLDDFESIMEDACFNGTLQNGTVASKSISRGKWVRPVGNFEGNGEMITFSTFSFWTFKDGKVVSIESAIDNSRVPKWQQAWNLYRV